MKAHYTLKINKKAGTGPAVTILFFEYLNCWPEPAKYSTREERIHKSIEHRF